MHEWGDKDFDWNALSDSINYIMAFWKRWGRIGSHGKEKWGFFRDHAYFYTGEWPIYGLVKPGHVYYQWPDWIYKIDLFLGKIVRFLRIYKPIQWWQSKVYNYAIQKMCLKYPHIIDELVSSLEGYEMVKPGWFGKVDGTAIHKKYWREVK